MGWVWIRYQRALGKRFDDVCGDGHNKHLGFGYAWFMIAVLWAIFFRLSYRVYTHLSNLYGVGAHPCIFLLVEYQLSSRMPYYPSHPWIQ